MMKTCRMAFVFLIWILLASPFLQVDQAHAAAAVSESTAVCNENVTVQEALEEQTSALLEVYAQVIQQDGTIHIESGEYYELAISNADGSYTTVSCYGAFADAKAAMNANASVNAVVRDTRRSIGNKVVAMKQGVVVTTADKVGKSTLSYYYEGSTTVSGYVQNRIDTFYIDSTGSMVTIAFSGQKVSVDIAQVELIPSNQGIQSYYSKTSTGNLVHAVAKYTYQQTANRYTGAYESFTVGPGPTFMVAGVKYFSSNGADFYSDSALNSKAGTFYAYFKFLTFRSKTSYTADELNAYIASWNLPASVLNGTGAYFIEAQEEFGVNAAMLLAFAAHESGKGTSAIARDKNNIFGVNAVDSNPYGSATEFNSIRDSILYQAEYMISRGYLDANTDSRYYGPNVGNKKVGLNVCYASDPYWGEKIAGHVYQLDSYLGNEDYNKYQLAITKTTTNALCQPSLTCGSYYKYATKYTSLPTGIPVLITEDCAGWYQIQADMGVDDSKTTPATYQTVYRFTNSKGYVKEEEVSFINEPALLFLDPALGTAEASVQYQSHIQDIGWQDWMANGEVSGTIGKGLRLEALRVQLANIGGSVEYRTHVQELGWQDYESDGAISGTSGLSYRIEAVNIRLTGEVQEDYDIYYRVHVQNIGWMGWAKNDEPAGTTGLSYRIEAIQIELVPKGGAAPGATSLSYLDKSTIAVKPSIAYRSHVQNIGWQSWVKDGAVSGSTGLSYRLEAMQIQLSNAVGHVEYRSHVQNIGWTDYVCDGAVTGTVGLSYRMEAVSIYLSGEIAEDCDIYYRVHAQNYGWMGWAKNGESAGTTGLGLRLEAIQIQLVPKGNPAPGSTAGSYVTR